MNKDFIIKWSKAALIRGIKTFAQTAIGVCGSCALLSEVDFKVVLSASTFAFIISILTSVSGLPEVGDKNDK